MELHRVQLLLQQVSDSHDREKAKQELIKQGGITQKLGAALWVQDATEDLSAGKTADRVLDHPEAVNELVRLLEDDWFYLNWVLPEHEESTTPEDEIDYMVAFKTSDFSPPYPFIGTDPYAYLKPQYRTPAYFEGYEVRYIDDVIESVLDLKFLNSLADGLAWDTARMVEFIRANEHVVS